jgi:hypothetical protein
MVQVLVTFAEYATLILTPICCINNNRNWLISDCSLQIWWRNSLDSRNKFFPSLELALLISSNIWIFFTQIITILSRPQNSKVWPTTWASKRLSITVKYLLFWKIFCSFAINPCNRLYSTYGWKSPRGTTLPLIFYICYVFPINGRISLILRIVCWQIVHPWCEC